MNKLKRICFAILLITTGATLNVKAQKQEDVMTLLLNNSRPGANHALLGQLAGKWNFQDSKLAFVKGTLNRQAIYEGRFYTVEITGGKLQLPIADGKMKEDHYQSMQIEGYDNTIQKFITTSINNHIGSDIEFQKGNYNPAKKQFSYDWDSELIKGSIVHNRRILILTDPAHYTESFYELKSGKYIKTRELVYTRSE